MPRLFLIRHGVTEWSKDGRHTGRTDLPLLQEGLDEARAFSRELVGSGNDAVIDIDHVDAMERSPRLRCAQTVDAIFGSDNIRAQSKLPNIVVNDDLREWDYGAYEGITTRVIHQTNPTWDVFNDGCPDGPSHADQPGESPEQVSARADRVLSHVRKLHEQDKNVVLITHGHFSRVLIARYLRLPVQAGARFDMDTTGVAVLDYNHHSLDEPLLKAMFSPKLHPHLPAHTNEEEQYLNLISDVIYNGVLRQDRTGTGTRAIFAPQSNLKFSLRNNTLPLLTTKRVFLRGVLEELLWFISGSTDANKLTDRDIHIWDGNGSEEFLKQRGLGHRRQGDLGPVYGFQWRHFGAKYIDADTDYTGQGVDQLADVIDKIKNNPTDRRILLSAWNPSDLQLMALPPCHILCQFFVTTVTPEEQAEGKKPQLSCQMYQRSCDLGLGIPFNIASYSLLTHFIAHVTGCEAAEFTLVMGDAHVYLDHIEPLQQQLTREPRAFPQLRFRREVTDIDDFHPEDVEVLNYHPHGKIAMKMSV
ncbi:thymidylate synthase [Malassezia yamatoensis]|uniref:thymidylate synthase n=1 Tax=Malassezia yamatoensis TaxID=253288 RepID=A0AAJ6CFJ7_9BASI|nr:thymidylate synthase [Malassezia yamatoensis]